MRLENDKDEGAGALVRAGVALLKQDVPSAGVRVIMTSCFFGGASEEHEEHAAASLGREQLTSCFEGWERGA